MRSRLLGLSLLLSAVASPSIAAQRPVRVEVSNPAPIAGDTTDHMDLHPSGQGQFLAQVFDSGGTALKGQRLFWVSGNPKVATVGLLTGKVRALKVGYATIYASTLNGRVASSRACVVPLGHTALAPRITPGSVKVFPGRTLTPVRTLRVADTAQMVMTMALAAKDTTARQIDSWGPCIHWTLNAGPATPALPPAEQIAVGYHGALRIKCCLSAFYPSASLGTTLQASVPFFRSSGVPALRITEAAPASIRWSEFARPK